VGHRVAILAIAIAALFASLARAELSEHGDLFVSFHGAITPDALPRHSPAPISVNLAGKVKTLSGERLPAVRKISIAINHGGHIDTRGLAVCRQDEIEPSSSKEAMARCGPALVGEGHYNASIAFPEQTAFPTRGRILAFNAKIGGARAIIAHVYGTSPAPVTRIIVFAIHRHAGTYGTVLSAHLPASLNSGYGYLKQISLHLHRTYDYRGHTHSYLSAACEAPAGFPGAIFPFAHASMAFADGRTLTSTLIRSCRVRG
jgi:hypothetical protein